MRQYTIKNRWTGFILAATLIAAQHPTQAQQSELRVGDTFGYPALQHVINGQDGALDLAQYRGKLLILDFWTHGCTSCIKGFPKLDTLQRQFGDRLQIIAVNREPREATERFLSKLPSIRLPSFPMVTGDSLLHAQFPHAFVPHHVWVDTLGQVVYITNAQNTNSASIRDYLSGKAPELSEIRYAGPKSILNSPLTAPLEEDDAQYSLLTKAIPGVTVFNEIVRFRDGHPGGSRISANAASIAELFAIAYSEGGQRNIGGVAHIIAKEMDPNMLFRPRADSLFSTWDINHSYNYILRVPDSLASAIYRYMQEDLARYFRIRARFVKKRRDVLQLCIIDRTAVERQAAMLNTTLPAGSARYRNIPVAALVESLQERLSKQGRAEIVVAPKMQLPAISVAFDRAALSPLSVELLNDGLKAYGLKIVKKRKRVPVLVLERQ